MSEPTTVHPDPRQISRTGQIVRVSFVITAVLVVVFLFLYPTAREMRCRLDCVSHLHDYFLGKVPFDAIRCPRSGRSYVLEPERPEGLAPPIAWVVAYEPLSNHGGEGGAVLLSDGHVEWVKPMDQIAHIRASREMWAKVYRDHALTPPTYEPLPEFPEASGE